MSNNLQKIVLASIELHKSVVYGLSVFDFSFINCRFYRLVTNYFKND